MARKKKTDSMIKAVPLPESDTNIKDTWNPAELNEESKTKDTWNPAVLNEELKRFDSWNPAEINQYLNSKYNLEAVHDANIDEGLASFVTLESSTIQEIDYSLDQEEGSSSQIILQSSTNPPAQNHDPYVYRQIPSVATGKTKELITKITGASVVWNQLVQNGNFATNSDWDSPAGGTISIANNVCTFTAGSNVGSNARIRQNCATTANHIYFATATLTATKAIRANLYIGTGYIQDISANKRTVVSGLIKPSEDGTRFEVYVNYNSALSENDTVKVENAMLVDLTAHFGNHTIADYVNTLETTESGSGIAWLKSYGFFTEEYYAYSANTIQSVSVSGHKVVGFNQWDEEWELGIYNTSTGEKMDQNTNIRCKNPIKCFPNTTYYVRRNDKNCRILYYDSANNLISYEESLTLTTFTTPSNCKYIKFFMGTNYGTTYNNDICINISGAKNGTYEPYHAETTTLDHTTLRGQFYLDNDELKVDGDIYNADGSGEVKYAEVDMGSLDWTYDAPNNRFQTVGLTSTAKGNATTTIPNILCPKYTVFKASDTSTTSLGITLFTSGSYVYVRVIDPNYTSKEDFTTAMSGVYLLYEKATPTTATLTPFNPLSAIEQGGTEEFVDYGVQESDRDVSIPVSSIEFYFENATVVEVPNPPETLTSATVSIDNEGVVTITDTSGEEPETYTTSITMPDTLQGDNYMVVTPGTLTGVKYTRIQPKIRRTNK